MCQTQSHFGSCALTLFSWNAWFRDSTFFRVTNDVKTYLKTIKTCIIFYDSVVEPGSARQFCFYTCYQVGMQSPRGSAKWEHLRWCIHQLAAGAGWCLGSLLELVLLYRFSPCALSFLQYNRSVTRGNVPTVQEEKLLIFLVLTVELTQHHFFYRPMSWQLIGQTQIQRRKNRLPLSMRGTLKNLQPPLINHNALPCLHIFLSHCSNVASSERSVLALHRNHFLFAEHCFIFSYCNCTIVYIYLLICLFSLSPSLDWYAFIACLFTILSPFLRIIPSYFLNKRMNVIFIIYTTPVIEDKKKKSSDKVSTLKNSQPETQNLLIWIANVALQSQ